MRFFSDLLKTIGVMLLLCVVLELGLRVTGTKYESSFYESDPILYTALRPNARGWQAKEGESFVTINAQGMRDRERSLTTAPGTLRIAMLGDSTIAAEQVPLEKTLGQIMESKLNEELAPSNHSAEVLNFGVGGHTLPQELLTLQTKVWAFHPEIVILVLSPSSVPSCDRRLYPGNFPFYVMNDGQVVPDPKNHPPRASSPEAQRRHAFVGDLMNEVRLLQLVRKATQDGVQHEVAKLKGAKPYHNGNFVDMWLKPPASPAQKDAWTLAEGILAAMSRDAGSHGAEFWVSAVGPEIEENPDTSKKEKFLKDQGAEKFGYAEDRFQDMGAVHGFKFIPLERDMTRVAEESQTSLRGFFNTQPNRGHWNEKGNATAAAIVLQALSSQSAELSRYRSSNSVTVAKAPVNSQPSRID